MAFKSKYTGAQIESILDSAGTIAEELDKIKQSVSTQVKTGGGMIDFDQFVAERLDCSTCTFPVNSFQNLAVWQGFRFEVGQQIGVICREDVSDLWTTQFLTMHAPMFDERRPLVFSYLGSTCALDNKTTYARHYATEIESYDGGTFVAFIALGIDYDEESRKWNLKRIVYDCFCNDDAAPIYEALHQWIKEAPGKYVYFGEK